MKELSKLPSIKDLYHDTKMVIEDNKLNLLLNQPPQKSWVKHHPTIKVKIKNPTTGVESFVPMPYIPIPRLEWLMTRVFVKWRKEIKNVILMGNSALVVMRVWYRDPITNEWDWTEGVGAAPLQTNRGAGATDFSQLKSNAVQIGAPAAASFAFKNAVSSLGKLFGKDLVRQDEISYAGIMNDINSLSIPILKAKISELLDKNQDTEEKTAIIAMITAKESAGTATAEFYTNIVKTLENV